MLLQLIAGCGGNCGASNDHLYVLSAKKVAWHPVNVQWIPNERRERASLVAQVVENLPTTLEDPDSIPGSGRFSGEGNGHLLQYSCLEDSIDRGAWRTMGSQTFRHDWTTNTHTHTHTHTHTKEGKDGRKERREDSKGKSKSITNLTTFSFEDYLQTYILGTKDSDLYILCLFCQAQLALQIRASE